MTAFDIYKITENLSEFESNIGVFRIAPVWGREMSAQEYFNFMRPRVEAARRLLLPSELGCALAHYEAYKRICRANRPAMIFEDDILFDAEHLQKISDVVTEIGHPDFVQFARYRHPFRKTEIKAGTHVADTSQGFWGAAAYYASPQMARYLKQRHSRYVDLADNWQEFFVGCEYIPFYAPVFEHSGENTNIGEERFSAQNPSLFSGIKLRLMRRRMTLTSGFRHRRDTFRARRRLVNERRQKADTEAETS